MLLLSAAIVLAMIVPAARSAKAQPASPPAAVPQTAYVPERVFDTRRRAFTDFEAMLADLKGAAFVAVGEQHDDPNTHRLEAALLEGLRRRGVPVIVSLEMFERDVQDVLDEYAAGRLDEAGFLRQSRPWPRYGTDYRPLVELAKAHGWPIVAANVPRNYAALVAKTGLAALASLPDAERALVARDIQCPRDGYFERFAAAMTAHPMPGGEQPAEGEARERTERFYLAQCIKDETMAESMARASARAGAATLVHFNGAFHSDFGLGVVARLRRRLPDARIAVLSILPVDDLDAVAPQGEDLERADYLIYTVKAK